jgi:hypothetical protein
MTLVLAGGARGALAAQDPCAAFSWNIAHERALFATAPQSLAAGHDAASTPQLALDPLYELRLAPQGQVAMLLPPAGKKIIDDAHAGLARLQLQQAGSYRISVDQPAWIDVVADGSMIASADFQGRPECRAPHKIVQYRLPAGRQLTLQFSAAASAQLRLTITPEH